MWPRFHRKRKFGRPSSCEWQLPADNLDFHTIAMNLSRELPRKTGRTLADVVRAKTYAITASEAESASMSGADHKTMAAEDG